MRGGLWRARLPTDRSRGRVRRRWSLAAVRLYPLAPPPPPSPPPAAPEAKDTRAPTPPAGVTATAGSAGTVHVMWSAAGDDRAVTGYAVYREGRKVKDLPATTLMTDVIGLAPATSHTFTVRARDAAGNVSPPSAPVTATTLPATVEDRTPPSAPPA
ncbi:fibronectin type III domain-containing protein, partial [Streptomyces viridochromogenes]|uniref:fibronectin type III domain-containing protein n=1 Tax=Streptomyces viridochromogenes TaxID=1938 RepID=UPI003AF076C8